MRLPDFIIAGAPRSGTSWLYELLGRHPGVYMAKPRAPEPKFFLVDELYAQGLARYAQWFATAGPSQKAGEKSSNYLEQPVVAQRIARDLPDVKLVFVLREPVARAYSNYRWSRMNGREHADFATAVAREAERERDIEPALRYARPHAYVSRGFYADLLQPYFDRFPREHILVLRFEDVVSQPQRVAVRLHGFIDVPARPQDAAGLGVINESTEGGEGIPDDVRSQLRECYAEPNRRLRELLGDDFAGWSE